MIHFKLTTPMLKTDDIQATVDFYTSVLEFSAETVWPNDEPTMCILTKGGSRIMFDTSADWDNPGAGPLMMGQLIFDVSDVCTLHDRLKQNVEVLWGPEVYAYGRREFSIKDPNGYRLVFSQITPDPVSCSG